MATGSSSLASTSSFSRLLKGSKVISQYDPKLPVVLVSHGGSFKRSDFGLKRSLPRLTSPAIRVSHIDSPSTKLTDFQYASRELQFVKRWREAGVGITGGDLGQTDETEKIVQVAEPPGGCAWDTRTFEDVNYLKGIAETGRRRPIRLVEQERQQKKPRSYTRNQGTQSERAGVDPPVENTADQSTSTAASSEVASQPVASFPPDYLNLSESAFERFLHRLRELRPRYKAFLQTKLSPSQSLEDDDDDSNHKEATFLREMFRLAQLEPETKYQVGLLIDEFLAAEMGSQSHDPSLNNLHPRPHHSLGLSYAPPILYQMDVAARTIPSRVLGPPSSDTFRGARTPIGALGLVATTASSGIMGESSTHFQPDAEGQFNTDFGKLETRIESANLRQNSIINNDNSLGSVSRQQAAQDPTKTILDEEPILLNIYKAPNDSMMNIRDMAGPYRIGSQGWVARDTKTRTHKPMAEVSADELFYGPDNKDRYGYTKITPPNLGEFDRPDNVRGGRARNARQAAQEERGKDKEVNDLVNCRLRTVLHQFHGRLMRPLSRHFPLSQSCKD